MLDYFGFTVQLALLRVFNVKVKNLAFDTSKIITNAWFSMKNYHNDVICAVLFVNMHAFK